ncbi:hypothetical protein BGX27_002491 [Mortierella sp. AM989]|nr:hypothetical protein BGX27_002491 [Mortierella sp. AM989]
MSVPRTPSRIGKRTRYNTEPESLDTSTDQEHHEQQNENNENDPAPQSGALPTTTVPTGPSIHSELEQTKRLVNVFDTIDLNMTEARDKLKAFYKTADETNTLLDMWIRVLSQTEHTQKLLQDPAWEGQSMEEARDKEYQERRAAYHQAMEEANHHRSHGVSSNISNSSNFTSTPSMFASTSSSSATQVQGGLGSNLTSSIHSNTNLYNSHSKPLKKSPSALVAAAHAHASAIAANRKRNAVGGSTSGLPKTTTSTITTTHV